jgi:hypothetical protein
MRELSRDTRNKWMVGGSSGSTYKDVLNIAERQGLESGWMMLGTVEWGTVSEEGDESREEPIFRY